MSYAEDSERIRKARLPVTHYIYCPKAHAHWPDTGGVFGALSFCEIGIDDRRKVIAEYMTEGKQIKACVNGPYHDIQPIYRAMREGRTP